MSETTISETAAAVKPPLSEAELASFRRLHQIEPHDPAPQITDYVPVLYNLDGRCNGCQQTGVATKRLTNGTPFSFMWSCDACLPAVTAIVATHR